MVSDVEEVVGVDHLIDALHHGSSHGGDGVLRCYVGFEPSGKAHIGWKVLALQLRRMLDANANVMVFLADWHAWVNDKFNGDMDAIQTTGVYMQETFRALLDHPPEGEGPGELAVQVGFRTDGIKRLLGSSPPMFQRAQRWPWFAKPSPSWAEMRLPPTTTSPNSTTLPCRQPTFFEMDIDIAIGGMDQRKAHMFMRDVASKYGWAKATCLHTPIISSLKTSGARMESFDHKMSKSDPNGALLLHDTPEQIRKKMRKAYISPEDPQSPVYELAEHILLPEFGEIVVTPTRSSASRARGRTWRLFGPP